MGLTGNRLSAQTLQQHWRRRKPEAGKAPSLYLTWLMTIIHHVSKLDIWVLALCHHLRKSLCEALVAYHSWQDSIRMWGWQEHRIFLQELWMKVPALLQHSPFMPGAVSVQLLTCSYLETKGHCLDPPLAGVTLVFAVGGDSGEEDRWNWCLRSWK